METRAWTVAVACLLLLGCKSIGRVTFLSTDYLKSGKLPEGIVFSLPKSLLEVKIPYSLYKKNIWKADANGNPIKKDPKDSTINLAPLRVGYLVRVEEPILIDTVTISDPKMSFAFDPTKLDSFWNDTITKVELNTKGMLRSINVEQQDKTQEIIQNVTGIALNIASLIATGFREAKSGTDEVTEIEAAPTKKVTVARILDPELLVFKLVNEEYTATYSDLKNAKIIFGNIDSIPDVNIQITLKERLADIYAQQETLILSNCDPKKAFSIRGFPYRSPGPVRVAVYLDKEEVFSNSLFLYQTGLLACLPLTKKAFSDIKQSFSFNDDKCSLISYSMDAKSQAESMSSIAQEGTNTLLSGLTSYQKARLDQLDFEISLLNKQQALLKEQIALEKLMKENAALAADR